MLKLTKKVRCDVIKFFLKKNNFLVNKAMYCNTKGFLKSFNIDKVFDVRQNQLFLCQTFKYVCNFH
jgi:hypothetical protein